ncbi:hypothetical protein EX30DRAFT_243635 [Ascodesmis nigricans]|uniref:Uncharacterized protein n=1 Tax=Ascodesmis nigricans TaxID=341454 RepID=A0A4S2MQ20_9PEZI|nr:hypothetical protein EX30DRAFT_243635 [Ascodesmis nigricans]
MATEETPAVLASSPLIHLNRHLPLRRLCSTPTDHRRNYLFISFPRTSTFSFIVHINIVHLLVRYRPHGAAANDQKTQPQPTGTASTRVKESKMRRIGPRGCVRFVSGILPFSIPPGRPPVVSSLYITNNLRGWCGLGGGPHPIEDASCRCCAWARAVGASL